MAAIIIFWHHSPGTICHFYSAVFISLQILILIFIDHSLCARRSTKRFTYINLFNPSNNPVGYVASLQEIYCMCSDLHALSLTFSHWINLTRILSLSLELLRIMMSSWPHSDFTFPLEGHLLRDDPPRNTKYWSTQLQRRTLGSHYFLAFVWRLSLTLFSREVLLLPAFFSGSVHNQQVLSEGCR